MFSQALPVGRVLDTFALVIAAQRAHTITSAFTRCVQTPFHVAELTGSVLATLQAVAAVPMEFVLRVTSRAEADARGFDVASRAFPHDIWRNLCLSVWARIIITAGAKTTVKDHGNELFSTHSQPP